MSIPFSRRRLIALSALSLSGCGTIMYPERRGQPAGYLDWKVVALDGLGLLLFFIPGVIAFAVDFYSGAIYLPPEYRRLPPTQPFPPPPIPPPPGQPLSENTPSDRTLVTVNVPPEKMSLETVEHEVSKYTGREVRLKPGTYQTERLNSIEDYWASAEKLWRPWKRA